LAPVTNATCPSIFPVRVERLFGRVEEDGPEPVVPDLKVRRKGMGQLVGGEDVEMTALDERRQVHDLQ
jgi:hypothetical protein